MSKFKPLIKKLIASIESEFGKRLADNPGIRAFIARGINHPKIKLIYLAFLRAGIDHDKARVGAVIVYSRLYQDQTLPANEKLKLLEVSSEQAKRIFYRIQDKTMQKYGKVITHIIKYNPRVKYSIIIRSQPENYNQHNAQEAA